MKELEEIKTLKGSSAHYYEVDKDNTPLGIKVKGKHVNIKDIQPKLKDFLTELNNITGTTGENHGFEVLVTSGKDGKHSKGSEHYIGGAVDLRIPSSYRSSKASVYKAPIVKFFDSEEGKGLLNKYGLRALDPLHTKFSDETKTIQNAHMHVEFLGEGHYHGDGHNHSLEEEVSPTDETDLPEVSNKDIPSFEEELSYEMLEETKGSDELGLQKAKTEKNLIKQRIMQEIGNLQGFTEKREEAENISVEPVSQLNLSVSQQNGLSDIPDNLIFSN